MENTQTIIEIISKLFIFKKLTNPQIKKISKSFSKEYFSMGEQISIGKEPLEYVRILITGEVREIVEHPITKKFLTLNISPAKCDNGSI